MCVTNMQGQCQIVGEGDLKGNAIYCMSVCIICVSSKLPKAGGGHSTEKHFLLFKLTGKEVKTTIICTQSDQRATLEKHDK